MGFISFKGTDMRRVIPAVLLTGLALTLAALALSATSTASSGGFGPPSGTERTSSDRYDRIWKRIAPFQKRWARRTAECESGGNPRAIGGGGAYRGAFQFLRSTWKTSPGSPGGDPIWYRYRVQAVVAILLKKKMGTKPWPYCG
jgi:hypothetical protein